MGIFLGPNDYKSFANHLRSIPAQTRSTTECICDCCKIAKRVGKDSKKITSKPLPKLCSGCYSEISKGKPHLCNTTQMRENLDKNLSHQTKEIIASDYIKEKVTSSECKSVSLSTKNGPNLVVTQGKMEKNNVVLSANDIGNLSSALGLSTRKSILASKVLSSIDGIALEPNLESKVREKNHILDDFFVEENIKYVTKHTIKRPNGKNKIIQRKHEKVGIFCKDVEQLGKFIEKERNFKDPFFKIQLDSGGGFLKVSMTAQDKNKPPVPSKKRKLSCFKDTGVKKLIVLAIVQDIPENHSTLRAMLKILDLKRLSPKFSVDLKVANLLCGLQSHSCTHPCTWCRGKSPWENSAPHRTLGSLREKAAEFQSKETNFKNAKDYFNVVNIPLIDGPDDLKIIDIVVIPELHIMIGVTSKLTQELRKLDSYCRNTTKKIQKIDPKFDYIIAW